MAAGTTSELEPRSAPHAEPASYRVLGFALRAAHASRGVSALVAHGSGATVFGNTSLASQTMFWQRRSERCESQAAGRSPLPPEAPADRRCRRDRPRQL
jgi:hypothetical protein